MHTSDPRHGERGSALVVAILVMAILTLLGVSFLLMAETENKIAENEKLAAQTLYVGEAGVRLVKTWFDRPYGAINVTNPPIAVVDRTLRLIDHDGDPNTAPTLQDGSAAWPRYKQGIDGDADGNDDLFEKPYRSERVHMLMGTENGPDMRIDETASGAAKTYLQNLTTALVGDFPDVGRGIEARISRIDIYQPPQVDLNGQWTRYGMGTVKVISRIYRVDGGAEQVLAERQIVAVFNETPYPGPYGPLHSCDTLAFNGDFKVHWGVASAVAASDLPNNHKKMDGSWPRENSPNPRLDLLWGSTTDVAGWPVYKATLEAGGEPIQDPWFRYLSGGPLVGAPANAPGSDTPYPFTWDYVTPAPLGDGDFPHHNAVDPVTLAEWDATHSNLKQNVPSVNCPDFDYDLWKTIATSGSSDVHYYVWSSGTSFKENGFGAAQPFRDIVDFTAAGKEGLYFFDTTDGIAPRDDDNDGEFDNLTPEITIQGGASFGMRGFIYLNAYTFQTQGVGGRTATFNAPGEPFQDLDADGVFDPGDGEDWLNLAYPNTLGGMFPIDSADTFGGAVMRNTRGPDIVDDATLWGVLYNNGYFEATGNALYYGSVVSKSGVGETSPAAGTPDFYWDQSIIDSWPPDGWNLPRVVVTRWETD